MTGRYDQRTRKLLEAPITPTLLALAIPNVVVMVAQASVGLIETYFIGKLGTDALAGVALVFPVVMLMQMMSGGPWAVASHRPLPKRSVPDAGTMPIP
jgi:Na+-driven multidrug efflux pump